MTTTMISRVTLPILAFVSLSACASILDVDRFQKRGQAATGEDSGAAGTITYQDVVFSATSMQSHIGEYFELRIVDRDNAIQAKAVYTNVVDPNFSITMRRVVPTLKPPYRLDFWADHNNSLKYDGIVGGINDKDHAWRRSLVNPPTEEDVNYDAATGRYTINFLHDTNFIDIFTDLRGAPISGAETLLPFNLKLSAAGSHAGKSIEVRVVDAASGRLVALHRRGQAPESYTAQVLGVLDEETSYNVTVYADADGDGQPSPADTAWKLSLVSTRDGIDGTLDLTTSPTEPIQTLIDE